LSLVEELFEVLKTNPNANVYDVIRYCRKPEQVRSFYEKLLTYKAEEKVQRLPKLNYKTFLHAIADNDIAPSDVVFECLKDNNFGNYDTLTHLHKLDESQVTQVIDQILKEDPYFVPQYNTRMDKLSPTVINNWFEALKAKYDPSNPKNYSVESTLDYFVQRAAKYLDTPQLEFVLSTNSNMQCFYNIVESPNCPQWIIDYIIGKDVTLPDTPFVKNRFSNALAYSNRYQNVTEIALAHKSVSMKELEERLDSATEFNEHLVSAIVKRSDLSASIYDNLLSLFELQKYTGKDIENRMDIILTGLSNANGITQDQYDRCFDLISSFTKLSRSYRNDNRIIELFKHPLLQTKHFNNWSDVILAYLIAGNSWYVSRKDELLGIKTIIESNKMTPEQVVQMMDHIKNSPEVKTAGKRVSFTQSDLFDKITGYILENYGSIDTSIVSYLTRTIMTFTKNFETLINHPLVPEKDIIAKSKYKNEKVAALAKAALEKRNASKSTELQPV
jgi:uncharacterized protein (UPF0297 family)